MNNWVSNLFNIGGRQNLLNMFGRRRTNRGVLWASLIGLGVSAAAIGLGRNRTADNNILRPVENVMNTLKTTNNNKMPNMANLTEFADEFLPNNKR